MLEKSYIPKLESVYIIITNEMIWFIWNKAKEYTKARIEVPNIIDEVSFIDFKNEAINDILTIPLTQVNQNFSNYKIILKIWIVNNYFDTPLSNQRPYLL
jgi:hypothetical protein